MKLKCMRHCKRVHVLDGAKVVHREDGVRCTSHWLTIGGHEVTPETVRESYVTSAQLGQHLLRPITAEERLIAEVFATGTPTGDAVRASEVRTNG